MNPEPRALQTDIFARINELRPQLTDLARTIHAQPEIRFEEYKAADQLCDRLGGAGFHITRPLGGLETAFRAEKAGPEPGPSVAFLAEYDALPEIGHACGHNLIAAAAVGAAMGLGAVSDRLSGAIQVIGTPGEEGGGGKVFLAEAGVFQGIDAAIMFHPSGRNILWRRSLARRKLELEFFGRSAHASAHPDHGINALDAVIQTFNSINALREHTTDDARIHGVITHGGESPNVVPDYTRALFYVRALEDADCRKLQERVENCARGAALATGCRTEIQMTGAYKSLRTNGPLAETFRMHAEALGRTFEEVNPEKRLGSTDMGDVSHIVPAIHPYLSLTATPGDLPGHTTTFRDAAASPEGMETMIVAAKALAATGLSVLTDESLRDGIKSAFHSPS